MAIAFWLLPQLMCSDYFGGWPTSSKQRADGFGLERVLREWGRGKLTDFHRAPVLAWLSILGLGVAVLRHRRSTSRVLLFGVILFAWFTAGRVTFGPLVDWVFPPNRRLEGMMRWVAMLHLFLALSAGVGVEGLAAWAGRLGPLGRRPWVPAGLLLAGLLAFTWPGFAGDLAQGLRTSETLLDPRERRAWLEVGEVLRNEPGPGRVFTSDRTGHGSHWDMSYFSLLTGKPMGLSLGVGVQDSLNYFYLHDFDPLDPTPGRAAAQAEVFNVRYLVLRPGSDLRALVTRSVARRAGYEVVELEGDYGYFDLIREPIVVEDAAPAEVRTEFSDWLAHGLPGGERFLRLEQPVALSLPRLPSATLDFADNQRGSESGAGKSGAGERAGELGQVLEERVGLSRYAARVDVLSEDAWLLLKVTPHPFWEARVDGESRDFYTLSPAFMGLELPPGEHDVVFTFATPAWQKLLLLGSPLLMIGLFLFDRRSRGREKAVA